LEPSGGPAHALGLEPLNLSTKGLKEWGRPQYADLKRTKFGCRFFDLASAFEAKAQ
jgi:hypothetical protein